MAYTNEERTKILENVSQRLKAGESVSHALKTVGVSQQTYRNWVKPARRKTVKATPRAPRPDSSQVCVVYGKAMVFGSPEQMSRFVKTLH